MSKPTDPTTKQSRRRFAKTIAAALVAAPALAALSSCTTTPTTNGNAGNQNTTPCPSPSPYGTPIPTHIEFTGIEPPIIVDGGSCEITTLEEFSPKSGQPNHFELKPGQTTYKGVKGATVLNEYGTVLKGYAVSATQTLTVNVWFGAVKSVSSDVVDYDAPENDPQVVLKANGAGTSFDLFAVEALGQRKNEFKGKRLGKKYVIDKWKNGAKEFHLAKVQVLVDGVGDVFAQADQGFTIVVAFNP
ncbi:MAG TPA: hypothetical protein VE821_06605 [Pyrinomonadaceae bacterium]|nr:hypothetical protein [Pyrinomonadaceae bacterium]